MEKIRRFMVHGFNGMLCVMILNCIMNNKLASPTALVASVMGLIIFILQIYWIVKHPKKVMNHYGILFSPISTLLVAFMDLAITPIIYKMINPYISDIDLLTKGLTIGLLVALLFMNLLYLLIFVRTVDNKRFQAV